MRSLLMFDLPVETAKQRRDYSKFVKLLKELGFIMFQESIYVKLSINESAAKSVKETVAKNVPCEGYISILTITEKQFSSVEYLLGDFKTDVVNSDERIIEL